MRFADIPGHHDVKDRLRRMADSGRLPHAILLEGPEGCGKFALARALAQYIHCTNRTPDGDSCGVCASCRQHASFNHIDTVYSFPIKKKNSKTTVSNDWFAEFREFMTENPFMDFQAWTDRLDNTNSQPQIFVEESAELVRRLTFMSRRSDYKIALMWLPERMVEATANKLLKLVEEPYSDTIFIFTSDKPRQILPTIYSRTQHIEVKRYSDAELVAILRDSGIDEATAADAAPAASGNVNEGLRLAGNSTQRSEFFGLFTAMMRAAYGRRVAELRKWSLDVAGLGRDRQLQFIEYMSMMVRESFIAHLADNRLIRCSTQEQAFLSKFHPFINHKNVEDFVALLDTAAADITANANAKMVFFDVAIRAIILLRR